MAKTVDLSTYELADGTHAITVKAVGTYFTDSAASNSVSYVVQNGFTVTVTGEDYGGDVMYNGDYLAGGTHTIPANSVISCYAIASGSGHSCSISVDGQEVASAESWGGDNSCSYDYTVTSNITIEIGGNDDGWVAITTT